MLPVIKYFLKRLIRRGHLKLIGADGSVMELGTPGATPSCTARFQDANMLFKMVQDFSMAIGEAYMDNRITFEDGSSLHDFLTVFAINYCDAPPMPWNVVGNLCDPLVRAVQRNSLSASRQNVAHHYDLSIDFFRLFLDSDLQYSCGYFPHDGASIEEAQLAKKQLISSKLLLRPGLRVLDIGSGFGGLAIYLAKNFGVEVAGITLSREQYDVSVERAEREGVSHLVKFHLRDYREEMETYDRIVSVGMFEHVGLDHYPQFFATLRRLLKDDGVALLHSIGRMDGPGVSDAWMVKYIFPGGYAPAMSEVLPVIEKSALWTTDIEILRLHYAKTLRAWRANFEQHRDTIKEMYDERFCRMWEFYLIGAEMDFQYLHTMVFQMQITKSVDAVPLTRDYMLESQRSLNLV